MIFVDASAMVALALEEPEAAAIARVIDSGAPLCTSGIAIYEASMAISRCLLAPFSASFDEVHSMIRRGAIEVIPISQTSAFEALMAHKRFGKGQHPARLNMGDCFAYAVARSLDASILFVGDDFIHTDLPNALYAL